MRVVDIATTANSNLRRSKLRTFLTLLAIGIGTFTLALSLGLGQGLRNYISSQLGQYENVNLYSVTKKGATDFGGGFGNGDPKEYKENQVNANDFSSLFLTPADVEKISATNGVATVQIPYAVTFEFVQGADSKKYSAVTEVRVPQMPVEVVAGTDIGLQDQGQILLSRKFVSITGAASSQDAIGKDLTFTYKAASGELRTTTLKIAGVFEPTLIDASVKVSEPDAKRIATEQSLTGTPQFAGVYVSKEDGVSQEVFKQNLSDAGFGAQSIADINNTLNSIVTGVQLALAAFSGVAILASVVGVINTLYMAVLERTREIGLFRALGAKRKTIFALFSVEAALLGFWGGVFGLLFAFLAQTGINAVAASTFLKGVEGIQLLNITPVLIVLIIGVMAAITLLAGLLPALKASRLDPIEALRYE